MIKAPWTEQQVKNLNDYQRDGLMHDFTCGNDSRHHSLVATVNGWVCKDCSYTQDWAHQFMCDWDSEKQIEKHPFYKAAKELRGKNE